MHLRHWIINCYSDFSTHFDLYALFYVRQKDGGLKMQAVWAKSCRGAMVRYILTNQIINSEELKAFSYEGFEYNPHLGDELYPHFVREL